MAKVKALSASFIEDMKNALISEQAKLEKELSSFAHRNPKSSDAFDVDYPEVGTDEGENAAEVAQFSDNLSLEQELESALKDVKSALTALEKGEYGSCKYCKQQIDEARLRIRPTSTSCVACKKTLTQEV
ncbi:TraR/DksA family transcriptional regulator [Patescibacteria group bacterium]|nr:TraR/DksA family transcriptional regulator [Patescibacteria group bacterium]